MRKAEQFCRAPLAIAPTLLRVCGRRRPSGQDESTFLGNYKKQLEYWFRVWRQIISVHSSAKIACIAWLWCAWQSGLSGHADASGRTPRSRQHTCSALQLRSRRRGGHYLAHLSRAAPHVLLAPGRAESGHSVTIHSPSSDRRPHQVWLEIYSLCRAKQRRQAACDNWDQGCHSPPPPHTRIAREGLRYVAPRMRIWAASFPPRPRATQAPRTGGNILA